MNIMKCDTISNKYHNKKYLAIIITALKHTQNLKKQIHSIFRFIKLFKYYLYFIDDSNLACFH